MTWAEPGEVWDYYPSGACACGADLSGAEDLGVVRSFQQLEIPGPSARRIQHHLHRGLCGCGREHQAARQAGVPDSPASIPGPACSCRLPGRLPARAHRAVPGPDCRRDRGQVSAGFVHSCLRTAARLAADVIKLIATLITAAHVAGFDETTLRADPAGQKKYVLDAFTETCWLLFLGARTLESFRDFGILLGFRGVVVSDRYQNYFRPGWEQFAGHQACCAHLVRDYQDTAETYPAAIWQQRALRGLIRAWHHAREQGLTQIPAATADPLTREFRRAVIVGLASVPRIPGPKNSTAQHPGRDLLEFCRDREADVLRFTTDTRIWPTNNISERGVRPTNTQQRISGRLTSEDATQDRLDIRSYIETARKPQDRDLYIREHDYNNQISSFRAPVERAIADLKPGGFSSPITEGP